MSYIVWYTAQKAVFLTRHRPRRDSRCNERRSRSLTLHQFKAQFKAWFAKRGPAEIWPANQELSGAPVMISLSRWSSARLRGQRGRLDFPRSACLQRDDAFRWHSVICFCFVWDKRVFEVKLFPLAILFISVSSHIKWLPLSFSFGSNSFVCLPFRWNQRLAAGSFNPRLPLITQRADFPFPHFHPSSVLFLLASQIASPRLSSPFGLQQEQLTLATNVNMSKAICEGTNRHFWRCF